MKKFLSTKHWPSNSNFFNHSAVHIFVLGYPLLFRKGNQLFNSGYLLFRVINFMYEQYYLYITYVRFE